MKILQVTAQELLDSRGNPAVEATVHLDNHMKASGLAPSAASAGRFEAVELHDNDPQRYLGRGVLHAVQNVNALISPALVGQDVTDQRAIDRTLIELDGTDNKSYLGANAILAVSIACLRGGACAQQIPVYQHVAALCDRPPEGPYTLPMPLVNLINGGRHAVGSADFHEYMIVPLGAPTLVEAVRWSAEIFHHLKTVIQNRGWPTTGGDEGGYAPPVISNEEPLQLLLTAIAEAGYTAGEDVALALDPAASDLYEDGRYHLRKDGLVLTAEEMVALLAEWTERYPIVSIEDGLAQDDWDGFALLKHKTDNRIQIVGDDLFATNPARVRIGAAKDAAHSVLVNPNQIGTITEALDTIEIAHKCGMTALVSQRGGAVEPPLAACLSVGTGVGQVKTGSLSRTEHAAVYNQLMRIERRLGSHAVFAAFPFARHAEVTP